MDASGMQWWQNKQPRLSILRDGHTITRPIRNSDMSLSQLVPVQEELKSAW